MATPDGSAYERFKWFVLWTCVHEGFRGLWEPLWELRGTFGRQLDRERGAALSEQERQAWAERVVRDLVGEG